MMKTLSKKLKKIEKKVFLQDYYVLKVLCGSLPEEEIWVNGHKQA